MPGTIECPLCKKTLTAPKDAAGRQVRCPGCYGVFTMDAPSSVTTQPNPAPPPKQDEPSKWDTDSRRRRDDYDDDDDDFRPRRGRHRDDDDYDDDFDDLRDRRRRPYTPHRAGTIQTLGILSIVFCWLPGPGGILGLIGTILGFMDMSEIDAGRMDPAGRGGTQGGRICAIIGLVLSGVIFLLFFFGRFMR